MHSCNYEEEGEKVMNKDLVQNSDNTQVGDGSLPLDWLEEFFDIRNTQKDKSGTLVYATLKHQGDPDNLWANVLLGISKLDFSENIKATEYFDRALAMAPNNKHVLDIIIDAVSEANNRVLMYRYNEKAMNYFPEEEDYFYMCFTLLRETEKPDSLRKFIQQHGSKVDSSYRNLALSFTYYDDVYNSFSPFTDEEGEFMRITGEKALERAQQAIELLKTTLPNQFPRDTDGYYKEDLEELKKEIPGIEHNIKMEAGKKFIFDYAKVPLGMLVVGLVLMADKKYGFWGFLLMVLGIVGVLAARVPRWRLFAYNRPGGIGYNTFYAIRDFIRDFLKKRKK